MRCTLRVPVTLINMCILQRGSYVKITYSCYVFDVCVCVCVCIGVCLCVCCVYVCVDLHVLLQCSMTHLHSLPILKKIDL